MATFICIIFEEYNSMLIVPAQTMTHSGYFYSAFSSPLLLSLSRISLMGSYYKYKMTLLHQLNNWASQ